MYKVNKNKDPIPFKDIVKEASKKRFRESEVQDVIRELQQDGFLSIEFGESLMVKPLKEREDFGKIK